MNDVIRKLQYRYWGCLKQAELEIVGGSLGSAAQQRLGTVQTHSVCQNHGSHVRYAK